MNVYNHHGCILGLLLCVIFSIFIIFLSNKLTFGTDVLHFIHNKGDVENKQPNVIIFLADDLGWRDVGYHNSMIKTPVIDDLATNGVKIEHFYTSPMCTPSRCELMSGRYASRTGMQHFVLSPYEARGFDLNVTILPQKLKQAGYNTYMLGKWHLGYAKEEYLPHRRGFDKHFGIYTGHTNNKFSHTLPHKGTDILALVENGIPQPRYNGTYSTHIYTEKALEYLEEHLSSDSEKPFFLHMSYEAVHAPLDVPPTYEAPYLSLTNDSLRSKYAGMAACMDESIGNITAFLKQKKVFDNTVIIFTSDNGGFQYEGAVNFPLREGKGTFYEGGIRVPAFVYSQKIKKPNHSLKGLVHMTDLYTTIVILSGGTISHNDLVDGYNIWPSISEGEPSPRTEVLIGIDPIQPLYGESMYPDIFNTGVRAALLVGKWKICTGWIGYPFWQEKPPIDNILNITRNVHLFNIERDVRERYNYIHTNPKKVKELLKKLADYQTTIMIPEKSRIDKNWHPINGTFLPWLS